MASRPALVAALAAALVLVAPAAGDNSGKIERLHERVAAAKRREAALTAQIADVTTRIRSLERQVGDVSQRLTLLEHDLALHRQRLQKLNELYVFETKRLQFLRAQYRASLTELNRRLVQLYERPNPSAAEVIFDSASVQEAIDTLHYLSAIAAQDKQIAGTVAKARDDVRASRERTKKVRTVVASETRIVAIRADQQRQVRDQLLASQNRLSNARSSKRSALASTRELEQQWIQEANDLAAQDARVRAQLAQAQAHTTSAPSASGLIWPVSGPVVSPFGMRWGRLHAGIDIAVPSGTPIHAAASGTVALAGWVDGYGNYTCIDHGGGLATCYAHQSSIGVSTGQHVTQGEVIGYTGCTGHCLGPHLHFEVRINGAPVDPLGYL